MDHDFDVTVALNYYTPYVSGVTSAARVIAEGLVDAGYRVCVIAGRHDKDLRPWETINGVDVHRTWVAARISKGTISPGFVPAVVRAARRSKVLMMHMPMLESAAIAIMNRSRIPMISVYQCDVTLPDGILNRVQMNALDRSHATAFRHSDCVVVSSADYAGHSRLWPSIEPRMVVIPPPAIVRPVGRPTLRTTKGLHVGFLGRIVAEKGLEFLVEGFRKMPDPDARLLIAGDYLKVAGGSVVDSVRAAIGNDGRVSMLGFIPDEAIGDFYASIDVVVLPSVNALEAFGLAQVEGMMCGVPAMASDLPGVRQPVLRTGFGAIVPPRDPDAIATALTNMTPTGTQAHAFDTAVGAGRTRGIYSAQVVVEEFTRLVAEVIARRKTSGETRRAGSAT